MTCKDCIHYDVCQDLRYGDITDCDSQDCGGFFQNKADFVEVVRCKDCRHCEDYDEQDEYGWYHCAMHEMPTKLENFCNFGEKNDFKE